MYIDGTDDERKGIKLKLSFESLMVTYLWTKKTNYSPGTKSVESMETRRKSFKSDES